jgi:hypothetical protein
VPEPNTTSFWSAIRLRATFNPEYTRGHHRAGALHIVIEHAVVRRVCGEDVAGVFGPEVLEMQHRVGEQLMRGCDAGLNECVVVRAAVLRVAVTQVERVIQQGLVVGADIQRQRDGATRVDTGAGGVDRQLADGDLDTADTPIADAQDLLGVAAHDEIDIIGTQAQCVEGLRDLVGTIDGQVHRALTAVLIGVALDRRPDRGVIDHRQQFGQMLGEHLEIQHLVAVVYLLEQ